MPHLAGQVVEHVASLVVDSAPCRYGQARSVEHGQQLPRRRAPGRARAMHRITDPYDPVDPASGELDLFHGPHHAVARTRTKMKRSDTPTTRAQTPPTREPSRRPSRQGRASRSGRRRTGSSVDESGWESLTGDVRVRPDGDHRI